MIALTLGDVAELTGGVVDGADPGLTISGPVVADSRRVVPGALFVAVPGERADGHDFAVSAIADGAAAVLSTRPIGVPAVIVDDAVLGLGRLAHGYLRRLDKPLVVGITGSSGKTSTKDVVAALLAELGPTVAPEGSFNTEVGLPLTVLRADATTRQLVLEYSARAVGHIAYLCSVVRPQIGVVLNVGAAHVGEFGSRAVVAQAKGELVEALWPDGVAILNADDERVMTMPSRTVARVITFGLATEADVRASGVCLDDMARATFDLSAGGRTEHVSLLMHGGHQVSNCLAAAAVALEAGLDLETIAGALSKVRAVSQWRMQVSKRADGVIVVNDAYNANPESMRAALAALAAMKHVDGGAARRTFAVLGAMAELGTHSLAEHREVGAAAAGVDRLVVVGQLATPLADGAVEAGLEPSKVTVVDDVDQASELLAHELTADDVVLVKASRSANLQRVADKLVAAMPVVAVASSDPGRTGPQQ